MRPQLTFIAILAALVLLAYFINTAGYRIIASARTKGMQAKAPPGTFPKPHPPGVKVGSQLPWRELVRKAPTLLDSSGCLGGLVAGHFVQGTGDEQVVIVRDRSSWLFNADGTRGAIGLHGRGFMLNNAAWDYDGDGVDEIVPDSIGFNVSLRLPRSPSAASSSAGVPTDTPVFSIDGKQLARIPSIVVAKHWQLGDFDGDGTVDILAYPVTFKTVEVAKAFGVSGGLVASFMIGTRSLEGIAADIDGDGQDELVSIHAKPDRLVANHADGSETQLGAPPATMSSPLCAGDLMSGAGDEIVFSQGVVDPQTMSFLAFDTSPVDTSAPIAMYSGFSPPQICDFPALGGKVIVFPGPLTDEHSEVFMFDSQATLAYHEVFPRRMFEVTSMSSQGKDYIVLQFEDRILIYP